MISIKLTKRMKTIANMVDCRWVADIGCDHGKIIGYLYLNGKIDFAYISDISEASLNKAKTLLNSINCNHISSVSNGLSDLKEEYNIEQIIISGMGGNEIISILNNRAKLFTKNFILQPQRNEFELKQFLINNGFKIIKDVIVEDDKKFYNIIKVENGIEKVSEFDILFGKDNFCKNNSDFENYLAILKLKLNSLENVATSYNNIDIKKYLKYTKQAIKKLGEIK